MPGEYRLAARLLRRQWQAGELRLVLVATILAATLATLLTAVGDRLEQAFVHRAAEMLGADLIVSGSQPPSPALLAIGNNSALKNTVVVDFSTMLAAPGAGEDDPVVLTAARAVAENYPLRGELQILQNGLPVRAGNTPRRGEIWVEPRVADELGLQVGDRVDVGVLTLTISALVVQEPDRGGGFSAFNPRVLFNSADLAATGVVQPGSRVRYRTQYAGSVTAIAGARAAIEPQLKPYEELIDARTGTTASGNGRGAARGTAAWLANAMQFFALAGVLGIVLCGAAIGMAADRHARRLYDTVALLRTFGMRQAAIQRVLLVEVLALALFAGVVGALLGHAAQLALVFLVRDVLPAQLPAAGPAAAITGLLTALVALPVFALPALAQLRGLSPAHVLRREVIATRARQWLRYAPGMVLLAALVIAAAPRPQSAALLLLAVLALLAVTLPLAALLARQFKKWRSRMSLPWRLAADRLAYAPWRFAAQLVAFALIITTMTLATLLRGDLLDDWQQQLPADTPNVFVMNLLPHEDAAFTAALARLSITPGKLYPVTPGRLLRINETPIAERLVDNAEANAALDRDLILTEAEAGSALFPAPADGADQDHRVAQVSVEEKLAKQLVLQPGDTLVFLIAGRETSATVSGFRKVDWNSFQPNFYMVLSPGAFADAPTTWLTSFNTGNVQQAMRALRSEFPAATLLDVGPLLARVQTFVTALATGVQFVLGVLLMAALALLVATVAATLDERLVQAAVLRTLGARQALLRQSLLAEFALLGFLAGLLAMVATEIARALLLAYAMDVSWTPLPLAWLLVPPGSALLLAVAGWLAARRSLLADAAAVLKEAAT